ncbi:hypothetical protein K435DRAFT_805590 [Dendrothele bispora CBS 962.96]|uniref:Uncharacterized protein n=1 Tax=Dendrothele bispora (strain CBS 962.96) TaxID=1314807 RepID=A0A4S8LAK0_DENBC|nr:hypothetical protein K435DRAFT_805590 [Dendrothele bispora CBS 962.96]
MNPVRNSDKYFSLHFRKELIVYKATEFTNFVLYITLHMHKSSHTSILTMPLPQTQTSLPLSDSDLIEVKKWILEVALTSLLLGVQITLSIMVLYMFVPPIGKIISLDTRLEIGLNIMNRLNYVMGDMVVVWRSWVLFPQRMAAKVAFIFDQITIVGASLDTGFLIKRVIGNPSSTITSTIGTIVLVVPLILTNLTAIMLIIFKAWHHFQIIKHNLGSTNGSPKSGLLYLAFWVIMTIGYLVLELVTGVSDHTTIAQEVYLQIMPELVAIYPVLIILAVAHENNKPESLNDMSLSQSIRFASVQASKSEVHHSKSRGKSQLAFPSVGIDNSAEVEENEIDIVPHSD